jgi:hypothetical protein
MSFSCKEEWEMTKRRESSYSGRMSDLWTGKPNRKEGLFKGICELSERRG